MRVGSSAIPAAVLALALAGPASAENQYGPGVTDTEIKVGNIMPYSGPAAVYGLIGKTIAAYFNKVNDEGGVNGRKIKFISYDDAYNPANAIEQARRLVEADQVLLIFASLGTPSNSAIQQYMNASKVPHLFVASGASKWDDPANFPWTMGWQPSYQTEGHIYAQYLLENRPQGRIGILYQNDEYGKDFVKGLKDGLAGKIPIVAEVSYETSETSFVAQMQKLKASGADVFFDVSTPKFAVQVIKQMAAIGWKPLHLLNSVSNSIGSVLKPAGFENVQGTLSAYYLKEPSEQPVADDPDYRDWLAFMDGYMPGQEKNNTFTVYGYAIAQTLIAVLKQCGDDLTRENVMKQAAALKGVRPGMLIPGIAINTSAADFAPIEQMQMMKLTGERWERFGKVLSGVDPGAVSGGFKAIFRYGSATRDTTNQLNANTVTMMTGSFGETYVQIGADLASVLDDGDNLRLLPVVGRGSVQGIADILFLKGVDAGIVRSDTLDYLERKGYASNIKKQFAYIARLYNEEMHVVAAKSVHNIGDLDGKTVAVDLPDGGTFVTSILVFEHLGIRPHFVYREQRVAFEMLKRGEIDAVIAVEGKPLQSIAQLADPNLHLVPIDYDRSLQADYLPAQLTSDDYPNLIAKGEQVDTIAAAAVLAAFNWAPTTDRYRRLAHFVDAMFSKIKGLQRPPFHPKWKEVALNATVSGWTRFKPAQDWLDQHAVAATSDTRDKFGQFLTNRQARGSAVDSAGEREALFRRFLEWQKQQPAH